MILIMQVHWSQVQLSHDHLSQSGQLKVEPHLQVVSGYFILLCMHGVVGMGTAATAMAIPF